MFSWRLTVIFSFFLVVTCGAMHFTAFFTHANRNKRNTIQCLPDAVPKDHGMRVFLTVSSLAKTSPTTNITTQRELELNWYNAEVMMGDVVSLYDHDPSVNPTDPLVQILAINYPDNFYKTTVEFPRQNCYNVSLERQCLGFWISYSRQAQLIAVNCLKMEPTWMADNMEDLKIIKFTDMLIPGTHDTGSYAPYQAYKTDNIFYRWILTQEEDFMCQLMYGIRHFDLRLAYYAETPEVFWVNHDIFRVTPLVHLINACLRVLNETNEIILLDIHQFPVGFSNRPERHLELINYIIKELGQYLLPPSVGLGVTMEEIWSSGKRLIVAYNDEARSNSQFLWPGMKQLWAQTSNVNTLKAYFHSHMHSGRTDLWSAQLELTAEVSDIFSTASLRIFADRVNRNVTKWVRDLWWDLANVVALDYFLGSNIIEVAIEANKKRKLCIEQMIRLNSEGSIIRG